MVLTPEDLERLLREQIRQAALVRQQLDQPPRWLDRARRRFATLFADKVLVALWLVTVSGVVTAVIALVLALPYGGGVQESSLAIAQGSSLIFVVILVGLLSGPVDAGRRVGLGTSVVASDGKTWLGLGLVALLSLTLLLIGWSKPDRQEELATLAITAAGLGATGLVARRLLRLSNPEVHLEDQFARSLKAMRDYLSTSMESSNEALGRLGIESDVATSVERYVDPKVQRRVAMHTQAGMRLPRPLRPLPPLPPLPMGLGGDRGHAVGGCPVVATTPVAAALLPQWSRTWRSTSQARASTPLGGQLTRVPRAGADARSDRQVPVGWHGYHSKLSERAEAAPLCAPVFAASLLRSARLRQPAPVSPQQGHRGVLP
jgi:hypothetical protein